MVLAQHHSTADFKFVARFHRLLKMTDDLAFGRDATIRALRDEAINSDVPMVVVGGAAVIRHGYEQTTKDRGVLLSYRDAPRFAEALMDHPDWERLEVRGYASRYRPTDTIVEFHVSGDLMALGRPYLFPAVEEVETRGNIEGVPVIGLHDLLWLKLLAGRMQDLADIVQLLKLHEEQVDTERVLSRLEPADDDLRQIYLDLVRRVPLELANERRFGQGLHPRYPKSNKD